MSKVKLLFFLFDRLKRSLIKISHFFPKSFSSLQILKVTYYVQLLYGDQNCRLQISKLRRKAVNHRKQSPVKNMKDKICLLQQLKKQKYPLYMSSVGPPAIMLMQDTP